MASSVVTFDPLGPATGSPLPVAVRPCAWKTALQTALLISFSLVVVGVLWIRDTRSAAYTGEEDYVWENICGEIKSPSVTRESIEVDGYEHSPEFSHPAPLGSQEELERLLPVGTTYRVNVVGGVVGRLTDKAYIFERGANLAFAFQISYRRTIVSNTGGRIVELREYDAVRMAKIISKADEMKLALDPARSDRMNDLPFAGPGEGIAIASPGQVASAILESGAESVAMSRTSRAFLDEDLLSGKSIRLIYEGGMLHRVEPVDWTITKPLALYLFSQPALLTPLLQQEAVKSQDATLRASLLPPPFAPFGPRRFVTMPMEADGVASRYRVVLVAEEHRGRHARRHVPQATESFVPQGQVLCSDDNSFVTEAWVEWPLADLDSSSYRLLFETPLAFEKSPVLHCHYHCEAL